MTTEYKGQQNVAIIQDEKSLKNPIYEFMFNEGVTICYLESFLKYMKEK